MATGRFVAYYRVSTQRQGLSGLGLKAQQAAVHDHLNGGHWMLLAEFVEVESGGKDDRPQLARAIQRCRMTGAKLVISMLDRLSRDIHFLTGLQKAGIDFTAVDNPNANRLAVHILIAVAQHEREVISERDIPQSFTAAGTCVLRDRSKPTELRTSAVQGNVLMTLSLAPTSSSWADHTCGHYTQILWDKTRAVTEGERV